MFGIGMPELILILAIALIVIGGLLSFIGGIMLLVAAFSTSVLWGLGFLFVAALGWSAGCSQAPSPELDERAVELATIAAKAEPVVLRQRLQWQSSNGPTVRASSKRTPPQRQLARITACPPRVRTTRSRRSYSGRASLAAADQSAAFPSSSSPKMEFFTKVKAGRLAV